MKISIVIPAFNAELFLVRCLDSLVAQTYSNFEAIIVNDGSIDETQEIAERYDLKDARFIVINQRNLGVTDTRKNGVKKATRTYIFNLDSDDYLESNSLELFINKLNLRDYDIIVSNHWHHENNRTRKVINEIPKVANTSEYMKYLLLGKIRSYIWGKLIKRELLLDNDASAESLFYEDITTNYFIFSKPNINVGLLEQCTVNYFIHGNNTTKNVSGKYNNAFLDHIKYIKNMIQNLKLTNELSLELSFCICRHWADFSRMNKEGLNNKELKNEIKTKHFKNGSSLMKLSLKKEIVLFLMNHNLGYFCSNTLRSIYKSKYLKLNS